MHRSHDVEDTYSCNGQIMHIFVNASPKPLDIATPNFEVHRSNDVEGTDQFFLDPKVNVKDQIIYFLVNASPSKP